MSADAGTDTSVDRPRVLVAVTYGFSVRYLLPTGVLERLAEVCRPVVGLGWSDPVLEADLGRRGIEVIRLPDAELDHDYRMFRRKLALVHQRRLASPSTAVERAFRSAQARPRDRLIGQVRRLRDQVVVRRPGGAAAVESQERSEVARGSNVSAFGEMLRSASIDAVVSVTPYHEQDGLLLWAARDAGVPTITSVISFDNPTTRDRMMVQSQRILVWNRFNRDEVVRSYPEVAADQVTIIGAPQFDLHHRSDLRMTESEWRTALDIPSDRPVILYGAGPRMIVPDEARLVRSLDRAIDDGRIAGHPFLLVRRHPAEQAAEWAALGRELRQGTVVDPWAAGSDPNRSWPTESDLALQMSTLAHSAVHVNVCSSMTLDGAYFDRPQIGPRFLPGGSAAESARIAALYRREHWSPITESGGLTVADDEASLVDAINSALRHPELGAEGRRRMVCDLLTYVDGESSARLVAAIAEELAAG